MWKIQKPPSLDAFTEWKTVTKFFLALCRYTADCSAEITHALRWHSEKPTNNDKRRSYPDTLISKSLVSFADLPFKFLLLPPSHFLDPWRYCIQCVQNGDYSGGTERFVGISRQKQHLRPLCRTICKCELYCLSKKSPHFIDQQVITFHTFWDLISLHRKNALKYILLYFSKIAFQRMRHTFPVRLQRVFILFRWNLARMLPDNVAQKRCRGIVIFGLLRK